jgi:hypothetical protein
VKSLLRDTLRDLSLFNSPVPRYQATGNLHFSYGELLAI